MCFILFQIVSNCFNLFQFFSPFQHVSICFNLFQIVSNYSESYAWGLAPRRHADIVTNTDQIFWAVQNFKFALCYAI